REDCASHCWRAQSGRRGQRGRGCQARRLLKITHHGRRPTSRQATPPHQRRHAPEEEASMSRRRHLLFASAFLVGAAALLTPTAAAYIRPATTPTPTTIAVERLAPTIPVTDAAAVFIRTDSGLGS